MHSLHRTNARTKDRISVRHFDLSRSIPVDVENLPIFEHSLGSTRVKDRSTLRIAIDGFGAKSSARDHDSMRGSRAAVVVRVLRWVELPAVLGKVRGFWIVITIDPPLVGSLIPGLILWTSV